MEIQDYLNALRRRWKSVVAVAVLSVMGALGVSLLTTPIYAASTQLFVSTAQASTAGGAYQDNLFSQQRVTSYAQLITGQQVAQRVVDDLKLSMTADQVASEVSVKVVPETVLLEVTVQDPSPVRARDIANSVSTQFTGLATELETPVGATSALVRVTTVQPATAPNAPIIPATSRNVALGGLVGIVLGIVLALVRERLDTTVKSRERAAEAAGTAVIGSVPFDKDRPEHPLVDFEARNSVSAEAFRALRTNLQFLDVDNPPAAITVSSSVPGEGKTTTAINLAHVLAEADKHVILVEADLRRPRVARYLGLVESVGITTVLTGQAVLADVLQSTANPNLLVLAAGAHPPNPSELLGSAQMRELVAEMRGHADYIVFDAPPLLAVTDATVLTTITDGALLVVRHGNTKRDQLTRAAANLRAVEAQLLGVVVNMTPHKGAEEYEYYYYESEEEPTAGANSTSDHGGRRGTDGDATGDNQHFEDQLLGERDDKVENRAPGGDYSPGATQPHPAGAASRPSPVARGGGPSGFARHRSKLRGGGHPSTNS